MKRTFYITMFVVLGLLLQQVAHAILENAFIAYYIKDPAVYGFGYDFAALWHFHNIASVLLALLGFGLGLWGGIYWWKKLYNPDGTLQSEYARKWRW